MAREGKRFEVGRAAALPYLAAAGRADWPGTEKISNEAELQLCPTWLRRPFNLMRMDETDGKRAAGHHG